MRPYVLALVSAVAIASQSALAADPPPAQPPMPVPRSGAKHVTLSKEQLNHLKSAADHLASAGRKHDADTLREQIAVIESGQAEALLAKKEKELKALQSDVEQLRKLTRQQPQIVLAFQVFQISRERLKHFEVPNIELLLPRKEEKTTLQIVDPSKLGKLIEHLRENDLVKVLAEPTIVTVSGRPARFHSGGEVPTLKPGADSKASIEYVRFGTEVDVVPIVGGGDQVRIELRLRVAEIDPARSVTVGDYTMPAVRSRVLDTGVEMRLGQAMVLGGMSEIRRESQLDDEGKVQKADNEIETIVIVTPTRVDETQVAPRHHAGGSVGYYSPVPTATKAIDTRRRK